MGLTVRLMQLLFCGGAGGLLRVKLPAQLGDIGRFFLLGFGLQLDFFVLQFQLNIVVWHVVFPQ